MTVLDSHSLRVILGIWYVCITQANCSALLQAEACIPIQRLVILKYEIGIEIDLLEIYCQNKVY